MIRLSKFSGKKSNVGEWIECRVYERDAKLIPIGDANYIWGKKTVVHKQQRQRRK